MTETMQLGASVEEAITLKRWAAQRGCLVSIHWDGNHALEAASRFASALASG